MWLNLFGKTQHRKFTYFPRYYDPKREAFQDRLNKMRSEDKEDLDALKARISNNYKHRGRGQNPPLNTFRRKEIRKINRLRFYIILVLVLITLAFL